MKEWFFLCVRKTLSGQPPCPVTIWHGWNSEYLEKAENFVEQMRIPVASQNTPVVKPILDEAAVNLLQMGDMTYGGFGRAPKFPSAANISFLFRYGHLSGISKFTSFALLTLRKMAKGGIFDQIGGGFHRYSTDARWLVPHFEKMLYDNALLSVNYAEAYQITSDKFYLDVMITSKSFLLSFLDYIIQLVWFSSIMKCHRRDVHIVTQNCLGFPISSISYIVIETKCIKVSSLTEYFFNFFF